MKQLSLILIISYFLFFSCGNLEKTGIVEDINVTSIDYKGEKLYLYHSKDFMLWSKTNIKIVLGNGADSEDDGASNTKSIVTQLGHGDYAAFFCDSLTASGYSDWYLPSYEELNAIYLKKDDIKFDWYGNYYWSSTEYDSAYAKSISMLTGKTVYNMKKEAYNVVCARKD